MDAVESADSMSDDRRMSTSINVSMSEPISRMSIETDPSMYNYFVAPTNGEQLIIQRHF